MHLFFNTFALIVVHTITVHAFSIMAFNIILFLLMHICMQVVALHSVSTGLYTDVICSIFIRSPKYNSLVIYKFI